MDHAATTPLDKEVLEAMKPYFSEKFGNASSLHEFGREAKEALEESREKVAKVIGAEREEIYFTSGGTESDNLAIKGVTFKNKGKGKNHLITSKIEHHAVLHPCEYLEKNGFKVTYLPVDEFGLINLDNIENSIKKETSLISIMHANNEIGTIEPLKEIGKIVQEKGKGEVYFHTDAVQTIGKIPVNVNDLNVDLLSISAHKLYGPKGVGVLYVRKGTPIETILHGGGHERNLRSGTENVSGIVGLGKAIELAEKRMKEGENERLKKLRDKIIKGVLEEIPETRLNGHPKLRLPNNVNFSFSKIEGEALLLRLDKFGIAASTGSACSSKSLEPSHVLIAIGLTPEEAHGSLRLTLGKDNTDEDINYLLGVLPKVVQELREISPL